MAFLAGWSKRQKLTIDHTQVDDELTDFPVKVIVSSDNPLFDTAKSDGSDVRFTAADGETLLKFEREVHDTTEKIAVYHVKIPSVSSTSDTDFYLYYGNASASDASSPNDVWDSNYKLVLHMGPSLEDSTSNENDGTNYGTTLGLASDGYYRSFDGSNDYITFPTLGIFDGSVDFTIEMDFNQESGGTQKFIHFYAERCLHIQTGEKQADNALHARGAESSTWSDFVVGNQHSYNTRYHGVVTYNTSNGWELFKNGVSEDTNTGAVALDSFSASTYNEIGGRGYSGRQFYNGTISEVRISSTARSDAWIKATSASLHDDLLTFGSEESAAPPIQGVHQGVQIIFI